MHQPPEPFWPQSPPASGYRGIYINLDRSRERRRNVERQLAELGLTRTYRRLTAIDGRLLPRRGSLNTGIVGCFRSHLAAVEHATAADVPVHIAEDDIIMSPHIAPFIRYAAARGLLDTFDMVFLDMWVEPSLPLVQSYVDAIQRAKPLEPLDYARLSVIDMRGIRIGATASYVITPVKAAKLLGLLRAEAARGPSMPVDHCYTQLVRDGAITAAVVAPFLTGIDLKEGAVSLTFTMPEQEHRLFLLLRSGLFVGGDLAGVVIPGIDSYRRARHYAGLDAIRNILAESAGIPVD